MVSPKEDQANSFPCLQGGHELFDKLGWWNEIVEDLE